MLCTKRESIFFPYRIILLCGPVMDPDGFDFSYIWLRIWACILDNHATCKKKKNILRIANNGTNEEHTRTLN